MRKQTYVVKLSQCVHKLDGGNVDGEYPGGACLSEALTEAQWFAERTKGGRIAVCRVRADGLLDVLRLVREAA